jgi:carboxyl-terminal processing protease
MMSFSFYGCTNKKKVEETLQGYIAYFQSVYDIMDQNYYLPVNKDIFDGFVSEFKNKIFQTQVKDKTKVDDGIKHIGTGILVAKLKQPNDPFTNFFPPQMAKEFKNEVLGAAGDIGVDGYLKDARFFITQVEPRSDAFAKGVLIGDQITKVEGTPVGEISPENIKKMFTAPVGSEVNLEIFSPKTNATVPLTLKSTQYFKQSIFRIPTTNPQVVCLQVRFFNEETGNDMRRLIDTLNKEGVTKLIIDLRNNGGGPPLAAWDISGIFLEPEQRLFYFQRRNGGAQGLVVAPSEVKFPGEMAVLINKGTGSAAELFAGILQAYQKARLIGTPSAGLVYLKSLFDLKDGATLELTVAKGYLFNGNPIDADGLKPDIVSSDDANLLNLAVTELEKS